MSYGVFDPVTRPKYLIGFPTYYRAVSPLTRLSVVFSVVLFRRDTFSTSGVSTVIITVWTSAFTPSRLCFHVLGST